METTQALPPKPAFQEASFVDDEGIRWHSFLHFSNISWEWIKAASRGTELWGAIDRPDSKAWVGLEHIRDKLVRLSDPSWGA